MSQTMPVTIGEVSPLPRFEIKTKSFGGPIQCVGDHLVERKIEGSIGSIIARNALEPKFGAARLLLFNLFLNVDVR